LDDPSYYFFFWALSVVAIGATLSSKNFILLLTTFFLQKVLFLAWRAASQWLDKVFLALVGRSLASYIFSTYAQ
jgi:hypothetical protein